MVFLAVAACAPKPPAADARAHLTTAFRDSFSVTAPNVAFLDDSGPAESHLYLLFDTTAAPNLSDSAFTVYARNYAAFAMRHYEDASNLDSVSVATRATVDNGVWQVHHRATFAASGLK